MFVCIVHFLSLSLLQYSPIILSVQIPFPTNSWAVYLSYSLVFAFFVSFVCFCLFVTFVCFHFLFLLSNFSHFPPLSVQILFPANCHNFWFLASAGWSNVSKIFAHCKEVIFLDGSFWRKISIWITLKSLQGSWRETL